MGRMLPWDMTGIDFSATAFFLVVVMQQWRQAKSKVPAITGFISAIFFLFVLGKDNVLIPALSVSAACLAVMKDRFIYSNRMEMAK